MRVCLSIVMVCGSFCFASCTRYEWVPDYKSPECAEYQGPPSSGSIEVKPAPHANTDSITGRVIALGSRSPVQYAAILLDSARTRAVTDTAGRFTIAAEPGRHRLTVSRVGYNRYTTSFDFTQPSELTITLAEMMLDGPCSGFGMVAVKKPWWKIW